MIKRELKSLLINPLLVLVLAVILLIPSIYTVPFLSSMWDPYGKLSELPVAVVNEDQPVKYEKQTLSVGKDLVDNLKESKDLNFHFVDAKTAEKGLQDSTYYMTITIPKDFSHNASTVMDDQPQNMQLLYKTNPGTNYIASKLCETAVEKIKTGVSEEVTKTYTAAVFDGMDELASGMDDAADGSQKLLDGEKKLADGGSQLHTGLGTLTAGAGTLSQGAGDLNTGLRAYTKGVQAVDSGIGALGEGVVEFKQQVTSGAAALQKGAGTFTSGVSAYTAGVSTAKKGADQLAGNNDSLNQGISSLSSGAKQLQSGSSALSSGLQQMEKQVSSSLKTAKEEQIPQLTDSLNSFGDKMNQLNNLIQNSSGASASVQETDSSSIQNDLDAVKGQLSELKKTEGLSDDQKAAISSISEQLSQIKTEAAQTKSAKASGSGNLSQIQALSAGLSQQYPQMQKAITGGMNQLVTGYETIDTSLEKQLVPGAQQLSAGLGSMEQNVNETLAPGMKAYTAGVQNVASGLGLLDQQSSTLNNGAASLGKGASSLAQGIDKGADTMQTGIGKLEEGTGKLTKNSGALTSGSAALASGAREIQTGSMALADGSQTLYNGLLTLHSGTTELNDGLKDGAREVRENKADDDSIDMMAEPVQLSGTEEHPVADNGHAMAAYMMSVALWVGALAFCLMYPLTKYRGKLTSGFNWWLSKAIVLYPLAIGMAVAMLLLLSKICGFEPTDWKNTILLAGVASLAFMSLMYFFNALLGRVGSFIMLVFMIIQLAGSAGTYPIEISGDFVADINPFLPFSYTVMGFRSTISGCEVNLLPCYIMLLLIFIVFTALSILLFMGRAKKIKAGKPTFHDFMDAKGFA